LLLLCGKRGGGEERKGGFGKEFTTGVGHFLAPIWCCCCREQGRFTGNERKLPTLWREGSIPEMSRRRERIVFVQNPCKAATVDSARKVRRYEIPASRRGGLAWDRRGRRGERVCSRPGWQRS
jgi:hypothetical protein